MVKVEYPARILGDINFLSFISDNPDGKISHMKWLMHIKASSKRFKKKHNVLPYRDFELALNKGLFSEDQLKASFMRKCIPESIKSDDEIVENIKLAIRLTEDKPYSSKILTSPDKVEEYQGKEKLNQMKTVSVLGGKDALRLLQRYYTTFRNAREEARMRR